MKVVRAKLPALLGALGVAVRPGCRLPAGAVVGGARHRRRGSGRRWWRCCAPRRPTRSPGSSAAARSCTRSGCSRPGTARRTRTATPVEPDGARGALGRVVLSGTGGTLSAALDVVVHPDYAGPGRPADLALLRLADPAAVTPLPLAGPERAELLGAGRAGDRPRLGRDAPRTAARRRTTCRRPWFRSRHRTCARPRTPSASTPAGVVCAGEPSGDPAAPGADTCAGDSGGPLVGELVDDATGAGRRDECRLAELRRRPAGRVRAGRAVPRVGARGDRRGRAGTDARPSPRRRRASSARPAA